MAHWSIRYLLVPVYMYSWLSIIHMLGQFISKLSILFRSIACGIITIGFSQTGKVRSKLWILAFFLATAAVLVPAPLIEFRYYTIPFYFLVLHCNIRDDPHWLLTGMIYIGVNIFTMLMFLFRPFHWDHEPGIQRFIW